MLWAYSPAVVLILFTASAVAIGFTEAIPFHARVQQSESDIQSHSDKLPKTDPVEWKAFINYGGGYRVENECGKVVASDLSSAVVIRQARRKAKKLQKQVMVTYWAETPDGVEAERPFGPSGL